MAPKKSVTSVGFQLKKITTEQFAIIPEAYDDKNQDINMDLGLNFGVDTKSKVVAVFVKVQFEQQEKPFIIVEIANHFQVEEVAWDSFCTDSKNIIIPKGFATHLLVLTIGTIRGVLHGKTENTEFNHLILPTINTTELIKTDIELTIESHS